MALLKTARLGKTTTSLQQQKLNQTTSLYTEDQHQSVGQKSQTAASYQMLMLQWCHEDYPDATRANQATLSQLRTHNRSDSLADFNVR